MANGEALSTSASRTRRPRDVKFFFISKSDGAATLISRGTNFAGIVGRTLVMLADEGTVKRYCKFTEDDFVTPQSPTVAEIVTKLNKAVASGGLGAEFTASAVDGFLQIVSATTGTVSRLRVYDGTANEIFGWPNGLDIDVSAQTAVLPTYTTEEHPPQVDRWTFVTSTQVYTRVVPTTGETVDANIEGASLSIPGAVTAITCVHVRF